MKPVIHHMFPSAVAVLQNPDHPECKKTFMSRMHEHCIHVDGVGLISGEASGKVYLHADENLTNLFRFVDRGVSAFMEELRLDTERFDINIVKTWISVTDESTVTPVHTHETSHFSFVYYMHMPQLGDALAFQIERCVNEPFFGAFSEGSPRQRSLVKEYNLLNARQAIVQPEEGQLIVFPSHMAHGTVKMGYKGSEQRIAVAGDVLLVFNEDAPNYATGVFNPSTWRCFS